MHLPSSRNRRVLSLSIAPAAVLLAGLMVWQGSNAAFSARTQSTGNSWATGTVTLSDDDNGSAMFQIQNVVPGQSGSKCIVVKTTSLVPGVVKMYSGELVTNGLQDYVDVTIDQGIGGSFSDCTGFSVDPAATEDSQTLQSLFSSHTSFSSGILPWVTTGSALGESKTYKIGWVFNTVGLNQTAIDGLQGKTSSINFLWEQQNT
ncbi:MAG: hypothetical protein QOE58_628 [Actinomycetota bacterium]|jgi:hypothetical protein|nr:hypothetical protein [Actinomycetota bacterium]